MRFLLVSALVLAFCGSAFAQAEDTRPALQARLIADAARHGYGKEGALFGAGMSVPEGKAVRSGFDLTEGETYYVNGGCDENCTSLALLMTDAYTAGAIYSEDGNVVAHTAFDGTTHPSFTITAKKTGTYSIVINVAGCDGPDKMCIAGAAVFPATATEEGWVRTDDFTIDPKGTIVLSDAFSDETFCVLDTIDDDTGEAASQDLANGEWPAAIDAKFKEAVSDCIDTYDWAIAEGDLALVVSTTQILLNRALDEIEYTGVDYDAIAAIQQTLSKSQVAKFMDGTWLQDADLIAQMEAGLKAHGMGNDASELTVGETAIGAYSNQSLTIRKWVEMRTPR